MAYLARVSPILLPHLRDRPITLHRFPDGVEGERFFQKHWEDPLPDFVGTVRLYSERSKRDEVYLVCNGLPALLWPAQMADLELHIWCSRTGPEPDGHGLSTRFTGSTRNVKRSPLNYPDFLVFDLDPYTQAGRGARGEEPELGRRAFARACQAACWLKEALDALSLTCFVKTSGRTGLHVFVPVRRQFDYDAIRAPQDNPHDS